MQPMDTPDKEVVPSEIAVPEAPSGPLAQIEPLKQELAKAVKTKDLPRLQRVIGAATIAAAAQRRVVKLASGEGQPMEVVQAANEAANEAATVRLEAQAEAGRILQAMKGRGELSPGRQPDPEKPDPRSGSPRQTIPDLLGGNAAGAYQKAAEMARVAEVPDNVRAEYVDEVKDKGGEITTAGLLRFAKTSEPKPEPEEPTVDTELASMYNQVMRAMYAITVNPNAEIMAAWAIDNKRKTKFRAALQGTADWVQKALEILN